MQRHDVDAEQLGGVHHVLGIGPQRCAGALPSIATIKEQCARTVGANLLDQRGKVRETAHLAVDPGQLFKIQIREGMGIQRIGFEVEVVQEMVADQMRHLTAHAADAQVDIRLTEIDRVQLGMAVGNVQKRHIAECRRFVIAGCRRLSLGFTRRQRHARCCSCSQQLQE